MTLKVRRAGCVCSGANEERPWEIANFKGSKLEKQLILYCKQLQIDCRKLTEEEFRWFMRILKKSKLTSGSGRGKR